MSAELINCGQRFLQKGGFRISLKDICKINNIKEGDAVEVYIKKVEI